jgi:hypothetical protein
MILVPVKERKGKKGTPSDKNRITKIFYSG